MVAGRGFDAASAEPGIAIVNEAAARRHWPGQDVVGQTLIVGRDTGLPRDRCRQGRPHHRARRRRAVALLSADSPAGRRLPEAACSTRPTPRRQPPSPPSSRASIAGHGWRSGHSTSGWTRYWASLRSRHWPHRCSASRVWASRPWGCSASSGTSSGSGRGRSVSASRRRAGDGDHPARCRRQLTAGDRRVWLSGFSRARRVAGATQRALRRQPARPVHLRRCRAAAGGRGHGRELPPCAPRRAPQSTTQALRE